jgi:hypothetical protein
VISFKVATEEVHELKAQMNDKPLRIGKEPDLKKL